MIKRFVIALIFLWSSICFAQNYYVDPDNGNDSWDGKTTAKAWTTIAGAVNHTFYFGDKIYFADGAGWKSYAAPLGISNTTATEIITRARYILNETTADFFTNAEMLEWVNDGIDQIVTITKCFETTENITLATGTLFYAITTQYVDVFAAQHKTTAAYGSLLQENGDKILQENGDDILLEDEPTFVGLTKTNLQSIGHSYLSGDSLSPTKFAIWNDRVAIDPLPDSSVNGDTVILYLYSKPYPVVAGASIPLPSIYDDALVSYVAAQGFTKDGKPVVAQQFMEQYYSAVGRFGQDLGQKEKESEDVIR